MTSMRLFARTAVAAVASLALLGGTAGASLAEDAVGSAQSSQVKSCKAEKHDVKKAKKKLKKAKHAKKHKAKKVKKAKKNLKKQKHQKKKACKKNNGGGGDNGGGSPADQLKAGFQQAIDQVNGSPLPDPLKGPLVDALQQVADNIPSGGDSSQLGPFQDVLDQVQGAFGGGGTPGPETVLALIQALQNAGGGGLPGGLPISAGLSSAFDPLISGASSIPVVGPQIAAAITQIRANLPASGSADQLADAQAQLAQLQSLIPTDGAPSLSQITDLLIMLGLPIPALPIPLPI